MIVDIHSFVLLCMVVAYRLCNSAVQRCSDIGECSPSQVPYLKALCHAIRADCLLMKPHAPGR